MQSETGPSREIEERPPDYLGPKLDPEGLELTPEKLSDGVYALMADTIPKRNNRVIFGDQATLVLDAGINGAMSRRIRRPAQRLSARTPQSTPTQCRNFCSHPRACHRTPA